MKTNLSVVQFVDAILVKYLNTFVWKLENTITLNLIVYLTYFSAHVFFKYKYINSFWRQRVSLLNTKPRDLLGYSNTNFIVLLMCRVKGAGALLLNT